MANLAQIIPALFVGPGGQPLTEAQIRERQMMAQDLLAQATDTSPNAGGVASILAKGLSGFRAGMDRNAANNALQANAATNQSLISSLLGGIGSTGGVGQSATAASPTVAPVQNVAPATSGQTVASLTAGGVDPVSEVLINPNTTPAEKSAQIEYIKYANQGATRNQPLNEKLTSALGFLPDLGVTAEVFSGGQPAKGSGLARVGSVRHDDGNAADVFFYKDGRRLDWGNNDDRPIFEEIVKRGRAAGITGFGAGPGYMQQGSMHIGFGTPGVWGAGGRGANAPDWLRTAYGAQTSSPTQVAQRAPMPTYEQASSGVNPAIIAALSNPVANEQTRSVAGALLNNQMARQQAAQDRASARDNWIFQQDYQAQQQANDPLRQLQIQKAQRELAQAPGSDENFYGNPVAVQNPDGSVAYGQIGNRGTFKPIQLGEGQTFAPPTRTIDAGTETIMVDQAGNVISRTPKNNREAAAETAGGTVEGRVAAERATSASSDIQAGQNALDILNQIEKHPGIDLGTGATSLANRVPGTTGYDFQNIVEQAKSGAFLSAIQQMRGLGALSNTEGAAATSAITRMDTATSKDAFLKALGDYRKIVQQGIDRAQKNIKAPTDAESTQQAPAKRLKFNPATGMLE